MKNILIIVCLVAFFSSPAQDINITPMPAEITRQAGNSTINHSSAIILKKRGLENSARFLNEYLQKIYGFQLKIVQPGQVGKQSKNPIFPIILDSVAGRYAIPGAYTLQVSGKDITIRGENREGVFYGVSTLIQLLPNRVDKKEKSISHPIGPVQELTLPRVSITDKPRFPYRGMHLDVARHFFSVDYVKRYIDYLAYHKMNNFHWHLTDDQGWRFESKKYPNLVTVGSCRDQTLVGRFGSEIYDGKKYCGYYTQEQMKDVVAYAANRYINIIPEIDLPGHSSAALASYPFLGCTKGPYKVLDTWGVVPDVICAGNDSSYQFLEGVLEEVISIFPSPYIHIGGDECSKERWKQCPVCQQRIRSEKLADETALQSYFVKRLERYVNSKGRKIIGWDEILDGGIAPNAAIMSWRGEAGGIAAAKLRHPVVMCPETHCYLDHSQTRAEDSIVFGRFSPVEKVYEYEPIPAQLTKEESKYILGGQGNAWSEYMTNTSKLEYMIFPRLSALSEVFWTPKEKRNLANFVQRLPGLFERYRSWNANYSTAYFDLQPAVIPSPGGIAWKLETKDSNALIIYVKGRERSATFNYTGPLVISTSGEWGATTTGKDHVIKSSWTWQQFNLNKATGRKVRLTTEPNKSYSGSGGFTLVDGVQNNMGMSKSAQFLGFLGKDMEAVLNLDSVHDINEITLHAFEQKESWIYRPAFVQFYTSVDGTTFTPVDTLTDGVGKKNLLYSVKGKMKARYIKIFAKNYGLIPAGNPGAGTGAWLFVDEIEVK